MAGSEVPPWRTIIFEGGQLAGALGAPAVEAVPPADGFADPELDEVEPAVGFEVVGAGSQFDGVNFFLCGRCLAGGEFFVEGACAASDVGDAGFDITEGFCAGGVLP
jgi:hypothetical protein